MTTSKDREPYILTHSGARVGKHSGAPTIDDIAIALSRVPRFGGHSRVPWTVIQHSLFVERLAALHAKDFDPENVTEIRMHALLHDAHEAMTGDVPSPMKSLGIKVTQQSLDQRIADALVPERKGLFMHHTDFISSLDHRALLAEAAIVGPSVLEKEGAVLEHFGGEPFANDMAALVKMKYDFADYLPSGLRRVFTDKYTALRAALKAS